MEYLLYIIKFLHRIRLWLFISPIVVGIAAFIGTEHLPKTYTSNATIYTGIISGYNILSRSEVQATSTVQNSIIDNLLNIVSSDKTLKNVSMRLYARSMVYGNPDKDNQMYIKADNYKYLANHGKSIYHLIDKRSSNDSINEHNTYMNLIRNEKNDPKDYIYGIYNFQLPFVNREALKQIQVRRDGKSDMLELSYSASDPGIAYQTLKILADEFIKQYQELRFGETNNVISYFEAELERIGKKLRMAEDSLTSYSVEKRVINYEEETSQVAALKTEYELKYWESEQNNKISEKLMPELEKRMGISADIFRQNTQFVKTLGKISTLSNQITESQLNGTDTIQKRTDALRNKLADTEDSFHKFVEDYGSTKYSKEGISNSDIVKQWLDQVIMKEKTEAELKVLETRKDSLDQKYENYAPIGSTLVRRTRNVTIAEREYFETMTALNEARLRQKNLEMTSATLKIMNDPIFPTSALPTNRKMIVFGSVFLTLMFILGFFLIIELLDHTLYNKLRTEKLTGGRAIGAYPKSLKLKNRRYIKVYNERVTRVISNTVLTYFKPDNANIVNLISTEHGDGKSFIAEQLEEYWKSTGINVKMLSWHNDLSGKNLKLIDLSGHGENENDITIVEYPPLRDMALTGEILQNASVNLLIVDSRRTWTNTDQAHFKRLEELSGETPIFFVLNQVKRESAEEFTGLLPPYTFFRKLSYRFSQLGITATKEAVE